MNTRKDNEKLETLSDIASVYKNATSITMGAKGYGTEDRGTRQGAG
jgi:hypothetical protein